jgi:hypothetical protein
MFALMGLAWPLHPIVALIVGPVVYFGGLLLLRVIGPEEKRVLARLRGVNEYAANQRIEESVST